MNPLLHFLTLFCIYGLLAISLNLVVGHCGLLSLAQAAYFAFGAYTYALLTVCLRWGFFPSIFAAAFAGVVFSLFISLPTWRFRADLAILISLAVQMLTLELLQNWFLPQFALGSWQNLTNGLLGIQNIPRPNIWGWEMTTALHYFLLTFFVFLAGILIVWRLVGSTWGHQLRHLRENAKPMFDRRHQFHNIRRQAFAVGCALAAVAGALYAGYSGSVDSSLADLDHSLLMIGMVLIGGVGNFRGPLLGALILIAVPEILKFTHIPAHLSSSFHLFIFGILIIAICHFRPRGIAGDYRFRLPRNINQLGD